MYFLSMFQHLLLDEKYLQLVFLNFSFLLLQKTLELENTYDLAPFTVLTFLYVSYVPMQAGQARSQILVKAMDDYGFGVSAALNKTTESMVAETKNLAMRIFRVDEYSPVRRSFCLFYYLLLPQSNLPTWFGILNIVAQLYYPNLPLVYFCRENLEHLAKKCLLLDTPIFAFLTCQ